MRVTRVDGGPVRRRPVVGIDLNLEALLNTPTATSFTCRWSRQAGRSEKRSKRNPQ